MNHGLSRGRKGNNQALMNTQTKLLQEAMMLAEAKEVLAKVVVERVQKEDMEKMVRALAKMTGKGLHVLTGGDAKAAIEHRLFCVFSVQ